MPKQEGAQKQAQLLSLAEKALDFYTRHPAHSEVAVAKHLEFDALLGAAGLGNEEAKKRLGSVLEARVKDPSTPRNSLIMYRMLQVEQGSPSPEQFERSIHELRKEFPGVDNVDNLLMDAATRAATADRAIALAQEALQSRASEEIKERVPAFIESRKATLHPVDWTLTTLDDEEIPFESLKGKIVLVKFWASWCAPCIREMPEIQELHRRYKDRDVAIISITVDRNKEVAQKVIRERGLEWPQYLDADLRLSERYQLRSFPTTWLIDRHARIRDLAANYETEAKIERLLAEE